MNAAAGPAGRARGRGLLLAFGQVMRRALALLLLAACGPALDRAPPPPEPRLQAASPGLLATAAGVDGVITTLARYDDGTPHPGENAIDVGAPGGAPVWHQVDYLPANLGGGYLYVEQVQEPGRCSQWSPGSPYYNGAKLYVYTYFWVDGGWRVHREAYQHVEPAVPLGAWLRWNNAGAGEPLWPPWEADAVLGNQTHGGLLAGSVYPVAGPIYNGPGGYLCTTGSHLHQEGQGQRAGRRWVGERVTARYNDLHLFGL